MKKRKELNALIGLGDSKRKKTKKGSGHRLLRTEPPDSESESSSDDDEFNNVGSVAAFGKRSYAKCCNVCYPLCAFIITAACVMACAGLIWMQIALKEDLDSLKEKLHTMESSQKISSHEIPKLSEDLKAKQRKLEDLENGDRGLTKLWSNLTEMNRKIGLLESSVNHLKGNIKSASDLLNLPTTVEELQKSVATIGSTLTSVQHDAETMQTALEGQRTEMANLRSHMQGGVKESMTNSAEKQTANCSSASVPKQELLELRGALREVNDSQELLASRAEGQLRALHSAVFSLSQRVAGLGNLSQRVAGLENLSPRVPQRPSNDSTKLLDRTLVKGNITELVDYRNSADESPELPGSSVLEQDSTQSSVSEQTRRPQFRSPRRSRREAGSGKPKAGYFSGISSVRDLQGLIRSGEQGLASPGPSHADPRGLIGASTADTHAVERPDKD